MGILAIATIAAVVTLAVGLPVTQQKASTAKPEKAQESDLGDVLEYERYLREVVEALESDADFRKKLDKAPEADIRSGKIAQELEYVNHHVRSKLDEIKRREIERLRELANKQFELTNEIDRSNLKIGHVQHDNQHTFEIEDLRRLILKTSEDLAEADRKRREEFKQYEMQKEFEHQQKLTELDEEGKKKFEEELKQQKEKHNKHEKVHHPGNKAQLEEVWENQDHMDGVDFDPKVFFKLHDLDSNGYWDENELKALFVKELDKVYKQGLPEDDMRERAEEMERMREHVFKEADTNRDGLISYDEFIEQTKRDEFNRDPGWDTVDNIPQYTHEEYIEFERKRQEEIQKLINSGALPAHPNMPQGYYPNGQPHPNQQQMHYQQQPQYHQQQVHHQQQQQALYQQQQAQQYHQQQQLHEQQQQQMHQQYVQQSKPPGQIPQGGAQPPPQQFQQQYQQPPPQQVGQQPPPPQQQQQFQQLPPQQQQQQQYQQPPPQQQQQFQQPPPQQQQQKFQQPPPQQQQQQFQQPPPQQQQQFQQPPPQQQQQQFQQPPPQQPVGQPTATNNQQLQQGVPQQNVAQNGGGAAAQPPPPAPNANAIPPPNQNNQPQQNGQHN